MRKIEKDFFISKGYNLIKLDSSNNTYDEISSHVDIFCTKIENELIVEPTVYEEIKKYDKYCSIGNSRVGNKYPSDIAYNMCIMWKTALHNFKFTDKIVLEKLNSMGYELINVKQGYSKCSTCVLNGKVCITSDKGIYIELKKREFDILFVEEKNIRLLNKDSSYSNMVGFIGGATALIDNMLIIFGDINRLENKDKIIEFTKKYNIKIKDFEGLEIIDYGGVIEI